MDDYLKNHSTDDNTVMASVEDYRYFLDELNELNMLVTRAATDEESNSSTARYAPTKKTSKNNSTASTACSKDNNSAHKAADYHST